MIRQNLIKVFGQIEEEAKRAGRNIDDIFLVVISKGHTKEKILEAYDAGVRDFGENRVKEALEKITDTPKDIRWHFVGNLQKNKVSKVIGKFALIHSVDTFELAEKISNLSLNAGLVTSILLEANTSGEKAKSGQTPEIWKEKYLKMLDLKGISIQGLMTMAPFTEDESAIRQCFINLRHLRDDLEALGQFQLPTLSFGMSNDFRIAIQEGATLLRIGSLIFAPQ